MKEVMIPVGTRVAKALIDEAEDVFLFHTDGSKRKLPTPCKCYVYQKDDIDTDPYLVRIGAEDMARLGKVVCEFVCEGAEYYTGSEKQLFGLLKNKRCRMLCSAFVAYDNPKELSEFGLKKAPKKTKVLKGERRETKTNTH